MMDGESVNGAWHVVVALPSEIDATNAHDVRKTLTTAALKPGAEVVIGDMTATEFCDSMGIRALLRAHKGAIRNGAELRLVKPGNKAMRVLELTGADQVLIMFESLEDAVNT